MADDVREEDEWLYGESETIMKREQSSSQQQEYDEDDVDRSRPVAEGEESEKEEGETDDAQKQAEAVDGSDDALEEDDNDEDDEDDDEDSDDDDDGVQVTIGEIKTAAAPLPFGTAPTKRSGPPPDKKGKFSIEDFESPGTINGVAALDFNIDSVEDKPWRKPGADITDYFNYGFTEDTWRAYSDRQKRMRFEAGSSSQSMGQQNPPSKLDSRGIIAVQINNDNSKYAGSGNNATIIFPKKFGLNPMRNKDEIRRREEPRENTIQVMTADRREYSRKNFDMPPPPHVPPFAPPPFDTSVPPPNFPPTGQDYMPNPEYFNHPPPPYYHEMHDEHQGYDEQQWMEPGWDMNVDMSRPPPGSAIVSLTKASNVPPPPGEGDSTPPTAIKDEVPDN